jgi:outer membrane lipoprotein SlyB
MRLLSRPAFRFLPMTAAALVAAMVAACASGPRMSSTGSPPSASVSAPSALEFGRITSIEYVPAGAAAVGSPNVIGAVVGGVAGAVLGRQIGGGSGRDAATVLGGVAGAVVGSQVGREQPITTTTSPTYRIAVLTDQGLMRTYEVPATGELRVGDRVRVENNVIHRL